MSEIHYEPQVEMPPLKIMLANAGDHFRLRATSWAMATVNLCVGVILTINPEALTTAPGANVYFGHLVSFMSPDAWRNLFALIGISRLSALFVNGTFPAIWWTPHLRMCMSFLSLIVWTQFAISIVMSGVPTIGWVLYSAAVVSEAYSTKTAATEAKQKRDGEFG